MAQGLLTRWNERRKLRKGRCHNCGTVLRDDAADRFCGDACRRDWQDSLAY